MFYFTISKINTLEKVKYNIKVVFPLKHEGEFLIFFTLASPPFHQTPLMAFYVHLKGYIRVFIYPFSHMVYGNSLGKLLTLFSFPPLKEASQ